MSAGTATSLTRRPRLALSRGLATMILATAAVFSLGFCFAPSSVSVGAIAGMLPFASVLAIIGLGLLLVVQQGGMDLSIPGAVSLGIVIVSHQPGGSDAKLLPAILLALSLAFASGVLVGYLVSVLGLNSIIATLGLNSVLYGLVMGISGGVASTTPKLLQSIAGGTSFGVPHAVIAAAIAMVAVAFLVKKTVAGRRFEAIGANFVATQTAGLQVRTYRAGAYISAQLLYCIAGILLAGITVQPTATQGNSYLFPAVAIVVLGGTSLLGGRGYPVATAVAALFLTQLDQFALGLGFPFAVRTIMQAAALAVGIALYSFDWSSFRERTRSRRATERFSRSDENLREQKETLAVGR